MNEKKLNLMKEGLTLFAEKGYHATSIQEIASKAGVSKGTFYLYYQSKEDFVVTSIEFIHSELSQQMKLLSLESASPRDSLAKQIALIIDYINQYKVFITIFMKENISIGNHFASLIEDVKLEHFKWLEETIESFYQSEPIGEFMIDAMIQLDGLLNGYIKVIVMQEMDLDYERVGQFIVRRFDNMIGGMLKEEKVSLIEKSQLISVPLSKKKEMNDIFQRMQEKIKKLSIDTEKKLQLFEVLDTLVNEKEKLANQSFLLQGLLAHFAAYPIFQEDCEKLAELWEIELL